MLLVRACAAEPQPSKPVFRLPKRLARARRVWESKRMDSFKEIHEALKKKADNEKEFLKSILKVMDEDEEDEGISSNASRDL
jgi:hypothetical protein